MFVDLPGLQADITISQLLDTWPQTAPLFLHRGMDCIGCPMASFCTLEEAARHYGITIQKIIQELARLIETEKPARDPQKEIGI